jgi:hypothetical protein
MKDNYTKKDIENFIDDVAYELANKLPEIKKMQCSVSDHYVDAISTFKEILNNKLNEFDGDPSTKGYEKSHPIIFLQCGHSGPNYNGNITTLSVGEELLMGVSDIELKCKAVKKSVELKIFDLNEALRAYKVTEEEYNIFKNK